MSQPIRPSPRRYRVDGDGNPQRIWNGKTPEEFTAADVRRFLSDTEARLKEVSPKQQPIREQLGKAAQEAAKDNAIRSAPAKDKAGRDGR